MNFGKLLGGIVLQIAHTSLYRFRIELVRLESLPTFVNICGLGSNWGLESYPMQLHVPEGLNHLLLLTAERDALGQGGVAHADTGIDPHTGALIDGSKRLLVLESESASEIEDTGVLGHSGGQGDQRLQL